MKRSIIYLILIFITHLQIFGSDIKDHNLFPNGGAENTFMNQIIIEGGGDNPDNGYKTHIEANEMDVPTYWHLTDGAELCKDIKYSGENSIKLIRGEEEVSAAVISDYWKVRDASMPFGLPLVSQKEITISFYYRTEGISEANTLKAIIKLGVIKDLPSKVDTLELEPSVKWKLVKRKITLNEIKWGCEVIFTLSGGVDGNAWIDNAYLGQDLDGVNLVKNHSFEEGTISESLPQGWRMPIEDQWVSWVGAQYRKPIIVEGESITGNKSLRSSVVYADGSGLSQIIPIHQKEVKPVAIDLWSKLDNSIGKKPPAGYDGPDNYANMTIYIYHYDGTMQEVSPTFCLGESDHDWDYRRFGFESLKPIKEILLQITVLGTEPTTSLWVDEVRAYEIGSSPEELEMRGIDYPRFSISSAWGKPKEEKIAEKFEIYNDEENLYLVIPQRDLDEEISIYLNARTESEFINHYRYLFDVIRIDKDGKVYKGITVEKQGYTADGEYSDGGEYGISIEKKKDIYTLTIPFSSLRQDPMVSFGQFGFNLLRKRGEERDYWHGKSANNKEMGRIILAKVPGVRIKSIQFGKRYYYEEDQAQDFVSHPQLYSGENEAIIELINEGPGGEITIAGGIKGGPVTKKIIQIGSAEVSKIVFPYQAGLEKSTQFEISLLGADMEEIKESYPIQVPKAIEIVPDQEYYFAEEGIANVEIHNRYRPIQKKGKIEVEVKDLREGKIVDTFTKKLKDKADLLTIDISNYRINPLPVQDYSVTVKYYDDKGKELGKATKKFGKINHTVRRKLPPIEKLAIDNKGRIIINGNFRFFPIVPSVNIMDWDAAINLGANVYRSWYGKKNIAFTDTKRAWDKNVYTLTIGPYLPEILDQFEKEADSLMSQPGFLSCYAKQFYYWNLPPESIQLRKRVEEIVGSLSSPRLLIWGHHDSSLLYDLDMPEWQIPNPLIGYCYVKIMGRPGSTWRNSPFLTKTEMVLNPQRFKLSEVNYYVAFHGDEVVPEHFKDILSLRADDWHGVRNETYQAIIDGANGIYHWVCTQKKDLQRLRGWFQELNYMWPVYVADEAKNEIEILPGGSAIELELKIWEGKYYLLAANRDETLKTVNIRIDGFKGMKVKKLFELNNELTVKDDVIRDEWKKYDVHVYEIEIDN